MKQIKNVTTQDLLDTAEAELIEEQKAHAVRYLKKQLTKRASLQDELATLETHIKDIQGGDWDSIPDEEVSAANGVYYGIGSRNSATLSWK